MRLQDAAKLARIAAKHVNVDSARQFTNHVVPEVVRPARVIWNQAIGFLFFVLAIPAALRALQLYQSSKTDPNVGLGGVIALMVFVLVMVSFGLSSFLKARRIAARTNRP